MCRGMMNPLANPCTALGPWTLLRYVASIASPRTNHTLSGYETRFIRVGIVEIVLKMERTKTMKEWNEWRSAREVSGERSFHFIKTGFDLLINNEDDAHKEICRESKDDQPYRNQIEVVAGFVSVDTKGSGIEKQGATLLNDRTHYHRIPRRQGQRWSYLDRPIQK